MSLTGSAEDWISVVASSAVTSSSLSQSGRAVQPPVVTSEAGRANCAPVCASPGSAGPVAANARRSATATAANAPSPTTARGDATPSARRATRRTRSDAGLRFLPMCWIPRVHCSITRYLRNWARERRAVQRRLLIDQLESFWLIAAFGFRRGVEEIQKAPPGCSPRRRRASPSDCIAGGGADRFPGLYLQEQAQPVKQRSCYRA